MNLQILKYPLPQIIGEIIEVEMPDRWAICDINHQGDELFLWANVDTDEPVTANKFIIYGTGWEIRDMENLSFLKTVHMPNGMVWHVFSPGDR